MGEIRLPELPSETAMRVQAALELQPLSTSEQKEAHRTMIHLIEEVRHCSQPSHYRTAQRHLGEQIERVDAAAEAAGTRQKQWKKELEKLPHQKHVDYLSAVGHINIQRFKAELEKEFYYQLGHQYRMIGDALAWQLYEFQALPLYALGMNSFPGPISASKKVGAEAENQWVEQYWLEEGTFALRHDYTNCLRVWDLSIFAPGETPVIQEVKADGRSPSPDQKQKGMRASELCNLHQSMLEGHLLLHRSHTNSASRGWDQTNLSLLRQALIQALQQGIGCTANSYLEIAVLDTRNRARVPPDQLHQAWQHKLNIPVPPELWPLPCVDVLRCDSRQRIQYPCFGAPYTIYPLPAAVIADVLAGYLLVHYRVNTAAIARAFHEKGFEAQCLLGAWRDQGKPQPKKVGGPYFRLQREGITIGITRMTIEQMTFEGVLLEDLVDSVDVFAKQLTAQSSPIYPPKERTQFHHIYTFCTYTDGEDFWRTSRKVVASPYEWRSGKLFVVSNN